MLEGEIRLEYTSVSHFQSRQLVKISKNAEWVKQICIEAQIQGGARGWTVLKPLQTAGENYASRGRRSGEQSQSVTKPGRRMGRRPGEHS